MNIINPRLTVRAILIDGDRLALIKRTKNGQEPYLTFVGGGVEPEDTSLKSALKREIYEEIGATAAIHGDAFWVSKDSKAIQHFYIATSDLSTRSKTSEVDQIQPLENRRELVMLDCTAEKVLAAPIRPTEIKPEIVQRLAEILELTSSKKSHDNMAG